LRKKKLTKAEKQRQNQGAKDDKTNQTEKGENAIKH
jgi:hypothetical protein